MRWSLRSMLALFAAASIALAFGKYSPVVSGAVLSLILAAAAFFMSKAIWRRLAYGSVLGIVAAHCVLWAIVFIRFGRLIASNYQESFEMMEFTEPWTPYVVPVGTLIGATIAVACIPVQMAARPNDATCPDDSLTAASSSKGETDEDAAG